MNESIAIKLFASLDILVLEYLGDGLFKSIAPLPKWFNEFYPEIEQECVGLRLGNRFSFLANFLIDAENFWANNLNGQLRSGLWIETDHADVEHYFEAKALLVEDKRIMMIELSHTEYTEKQALIQKARENNLELSRMIKETQKKEILLHCIVHDLKQPLTAIQAALELIKRDADSLSEFSAQFLEIGLGSCIMQDVMIKEILTAFTTDVEALNNFTFDAARSPDIAVSIKNIIESLSPAFLINKVKLKFDDVDPTKNWKVVGERARLERVLTNLMVNALRYSPLNSTVTIGLVDEGKYILATVEDEGPGVDKEIIGRLFQKFTQSKKNAGAIGLGLYFCRITIERWQGTIGYLPRKEQGSSFWFRLPKPQ